MQDEGTGAPTLSDDAGIVASGAILSAPCETGEADAVNLIVDTGTVEFLLLGELLVAPLLDEHVPRVRGPVSLLHLKMT